MPMYRRRTGPDMADGTTNMPGEASMGAATDRLPASAA